MLQVPETQTSNKNDRNIICDDKYSAGSTVRQAGWSDRSDGLEEKFLPAFGFSIYIAI